YLYQTSHTAIYTLSLHDALPISQLLDMVAIQVSERHVEAAVRDAFPSFVDGNDVLSRVVLDVNLLLDRNLLRADECHRDRHADPATSDQQPVPERFHCGCPGDAAVVS